MNPSTGCQSNSAKFLEPLFLADRLEWMETRSAKAGGFPEVDRFVLRARGVYNDVREGPGSLFEISRRIPGARA